MEFSFQIIIVAILVLVAAFLIIAFLSGAFGESGKAFSSLTQMIMGGIK